MKRVGLIRVLTTENEELLKAHGKMIMKYFPGLEVLSACISDQPEGVHDDATEALAVPKVQELGLIMERDGVEAVIVSCAGDPGVESLADTLKIPVIGAGRSVASVGRALERPVGVLGLTHIVPSAIRRILGDFLVADAVPEGVNSTLDLMTERGMKAVLETGQSLVSRGARALILACTGLSTIGAAAKLREALKIPVVDPVQAEGAITWLALGGNAE